MKLKTKISMALVSVLTFPALASALPLIEKSSGGGYTPPEWQKFESCTLFADKVVIEHDYGVDEKKAVKVTREEKVSIAGAIQDLLLKASQEKEVRTQNGLCDAPSTAVVGHLVGAPETDKGFLLFVTGGCGSDRIERQGPASSALRNLIDQYCPLTYDQK